MKTLAEQLRDRKVVIDNQKNQIKTDEMAKIKTKWDCAIAIATGIETRQKLFNKVESFTGDFNYFTFVVMDSRTVPNRKGGSHYDIPLNGGGNMFCAIQDGKVTQETLYEWYPPFATVRDFYVREGFEVKICEGDDGCGMESWLNLVISL